MTRKVLCNIIKFNARFLDTSEKFIVLASSCYRDFVIGLGYHDNPFEIYWPEHFFFALLCQAGRLENGKIKSSKLMVCEQSYCQLCTGISVSLKRPASTVFLQPNNGRKELFILFI